MEISEKLKFFLEENKDLINNYQFEELYKNSSINSKDITEILYKAGLDPLHHMKNIPVNFAFNSDFFIGKLIIPGNIKSIGGDAFAYNKNLTKVIIKNGVEKIGLTAFRSCPNLTSILIPKSVNKIATGLCSFCPNVTIYCEADKPGDKWDPSWNWNGDRSKEGNKEVPVIWNVKEEDVK